MSLNVFNIPFDSDFDHYNTVILTVQYLFAGCCADSHYAFPRDSLVQQFDLNSVFAELVNTFPFMHVNFLVCFFSNQCNEDEAYREQADEEMKMHQSYRIKALLCRKGYMYFLICHLESGEKELPKDLKMVICPTIRINTSMQNQLFRIIRSCAFLLIF